MADASSTLVSIIIPAFNAAEFIGQTLASVSQQTFTAHEVVVINDGSPDTEELERELERYSGRLRYIKQENQGAAAARNAGLRSASGDLVAFLDADDIWLPTFLEKQVHLLQQSGADVVFADALLTGESPIAGRTFMELQPSRGEVTPESLLSIKVTVLTSTVVARKQPVIDAGLFDVKLRRGQDFDLWWRLAKRGARFAYHETVLAHHRIVESGLSGNTMSQLKRTLDVLDAIKTRGDLTPGEQAALQFNLNRTLAEIALENGKEKLQQRDFAGALGEFRESSRFRRQSLLESGAWGRFRQGWKLMLVCLGLRVAPELLWRIYNRPPLSPGNASPD